MNTAYLLMNISKQLKYNLNQALISQELTIQQWAVIQQLSRKEKSTAAELASILEMDKPTMSGIVKRLENKGFLKKEENPKDNRSHLLTLTKSGTEKLGECQQISDRVLNDTLSVLTDKEQDTLNELLSKVN